MEMFATDCPLAICWWYIKWFQPIDDGQNTLPWSDYGEPQYLSYRHCDLESFIFMIALNYVKRRLHTFGSWDKNNRVFFSLRCKYETKPAF